MSQMLQPRLLGDVDTPPAGHSGTPPCALCCEMGERRTVDGGYYRYNGQRFGVQGPICRKCYFHFRRLVREHQRQQARDVLATSQRPAAEPQTHPRLPTVGPEPPGVRELAQRLHAVSGLRCCTVVEFRQWLVAALFSAGVGDDTADAECFCADAPAHWCALQRQAGLCRREGAVPLPFDQPGVWCPAKGGPMPNQVVHQLWVALGA